MSWREALEPQYALADLQPVAVFEPGPRGRAAVEEDPRFRRYDVEHEAAVLEGDAGHHQPIVGRRRPEGDVATQVAADTEGQGADDGDRPPPGARLPKPTPA